MPTELQALADQEKVDSDISSEITNAELNQRLESNAASEAGDFVEQTIPPSISGKSPNEESSQIYSDVSQLNSPAGDISVEEGAESIVASIISEMVDNAMTGKLSNVMFISIYLLQYFVPHLVR